MRRLIRTRNLLAGQIREENLCFPRRWVEHRIKYRKPRPRSGASDKCSRIPFSGAPVSLCLPAVTLHPDYTRSEVRSIQADQPALWLERAPGTGASLIWNQGYLTQTADLKSGQSDRVDNPPRLSLWSSRKAPVSSGWKRKPRRNERAPGPDAPFWFPPGARRPVQSGRHRAAANTERPKSNARAIDPRIT